MQMLTQDEQQVVEELLTAAIAPLPSPRQALVSALCADLSWDLGGYEPRTLVDEAMRLCFADGWKHSPTALSQLIEGLLPAHPAMVAILEKLRNPPLPAVTADAFDALVLSGKRPFVDRDPVRAALRKLLDRRPRELVVVVNGGRRAGKSYLTEFIQHALDERPDMNLCPVAIEPKQGAQVGPRELASDLVTSMGGHPRDLPPPTTNLDRWAQDLANEVLGVANESGQNWWLVLDGFNAGELRPETQLLITKLAASITKGRPAERHRLILIDFDRTVLPLQPGVIADRTIGPIPHDIVTGAIQKLIAAAEREVDPVELAKVSALMLDGLADPVGDLPELGLRLTDLIHSLESESSGANRRAS